MKYVYTEKDLELISWETVDQFINKIYIDVKNYLDENNYKIKYISPILRGGGVPAVKLSHMFNVVDFLPIQLKNNSATHSVDVKVNLDYVNDSTIKDDECILLVEGNHATGNTSNIAADMIRAKFGDNVKIIYVSLTRDYSHRDSVRNVCYTTWERLTNESMDLSQEVCEKLGIKYNIVSVYPWENKEEELAELNG